MGRTRDETVAVGFARARPRAAAEAAGRMEDVKSLKGRFRDDGRTTAERRIVCGECAIFPHLDPAGGDGARTRT